MERVQSTKRLDDLDRELWRARVGAAADRVIARLLSGDTKGMTLADVLVLEHDVQRASGAR